MSVPDVVRSTGRQHPAVTVQSSSKAGNGSNIEEEAGIKKGHVNSIASLFSQRLNSSEELRKIPVVTRKPSDRIKRQRQNSDNPSNLGYTPVGKPTRIQILQKTPEGDLDEQTHEQPVTRANARSVESDAPSESRPNFVTKKTKYSSRSAIPTDEPDDSQRNDGKTPNVIKMEEWTVYETLPLNESASTLKKKKERENEQRRRRQEEEEERRQREKEEEEEERRLQAEREANERRRRELEERRKREEKEEEQRRRQEEEDEEERERLRREEEWQRKGENRKKRRQQEEEERRRLQQQLQEEEEERRRRRQLADEEKRRRQQEREMEENEFHRQRQLEAGEQERRKEEEERRRRRQAEEERRRREREEELERRRKEREDDETPEMFTREEWTEYESAPKSQSYKQSRRQPYDADEVDPPAEYMGASSDSVIGYRRFLEDNASPNRPSEKPSRNLQRQQVDLEEKAAAEEERRRRQREERRRRKEDEDRRRAEEMEQRRAEEMERRQKEDRERSRRIEEEQRERERSQSRQREEEESRRQQETERSRRYEEKRRQNAEEEVVQRRREKERYAAPSRGPPEIDMLASNDSIVGYRRLLDEANEDKNNARNERRGRQEEIVVSSQSRGVRSTPQSASRREVDNKTPEIFSREEWTVYETIPSYASATETPIERKREQQRKKLKPEQSAEDVRMEEWTEYHSVPVNESQGKSAKQDHYDFGNEFLERRVDEGAETRMSTPFKVEEWTEVKKVPISLDEDEEDSQAASPTPRAPPVSQFDAWGAPALEENPWSFHRSSGRQRYVDPKGEGTYNRSNRLKSIADTGESSDDRHEQRQQHQQQLVRNRSDRRRAQQRFESDNEAAEEKIEEIMPRRRSSGRKKREAEMAAAIRHLETLTDRSESFDLSDSMLDDDSDEEGRSKSNRRNCSSGRDASVSGRRTPATRVSPYQSYHSVNQPDPHSGNVFHSRFNVSRDNPVYDNP